MRAARRGSRVPPQPASPAKRRGGRRATATDLEASGFFRKLFHAVPVAMLVRSARGRLVDANPACERLLGYTTGELRGFSMRALTHPDDLPETVARLQELIAGRLDHVHMEKRYRRKDGGIIWARSAVAAVRNQAGGVAHLVFFIEDITEQKRAEDALRASEARFRQLAEHIQDGVWMATADFSEILYLSPAIERLWGVTREELSANPLTNANFIHPADRERVVAAFARELEAPLELRHRVLRPDGRVRWLRVRAIPIRDEQGRVYRVAGITEDVTDRKHAADALEEARRHAARLVQAVREPLGLLYQALAPDAAQADVPEESFAVRAANLTARERQVMELLVAGRPTKAIAAALALSPKTVEAHRGHVMHKMRVRSVADLVRLALLDGGKNP